MTRFDAFANRRIIGLRYNGTRPWQIDFLIGPWRPFSYRRSIRKTGRHYLDLGRLGALRWGRLGNVSITITPDTSAYVSTLRRTSDDIQRQAMEQAMAKLRAITGTDIETAKWLNHAHLLAASGATDRLIYILARVAATGHLTYEDLLTLRAAGIDVHALPSTSQTGGETNA